MIALQPPIEPAISGFAQRLAVHVPVVELDHFDAVGHADSCVEFLEFLEGLASAFNREKIARRGADQHRSGRDHAHELCVVNPGCQQPRHILLRVCFSVVDSRFNFLWNRSDVGHDGCSFHPLIQHGDKGGQRSASGVARHPNTRRVRLGQGGQVIKGANSVPNPVARKVLAEQVFLDSRHAMLVEVKPTPVGQEIPILIALTLPHRVVGENDVAASNQADKEMLIHLISLSVRRVAARREDGRKRWASGCRHVKVGRDVVARQALEDNLADQVTLARKLADHPNV